MRFVEVINGRKAGFSEVAITINISGKTALWNIILRDRSWPCSQKETFDPFASGQ